jgi:hypothetical protein
VYDILANACLVQLTAPIEELLAVAIDDTADTIFNAGITGFLSH